MYLLFIIFINLIIHFIAVNFSQRLSNTFFYGSFISICWNKRFIKSDFAFNIIK